MWWIQLIVILITGIVIVYIDLKERRIPDKINIAILCSGLIVTVFFGDYLSHFLGFLLLGTGMLIIAIITKGFGMGDVKYVYVSGLLLGLKLGMYGLFIGVICGGIAGAILLISKKATRKDTFAYGPYLVLGNLIALLTI